MKGPLNIPSPPQVPVGYTDNVKGYNLHVAKVLGAFLVFIAAYLFTFVAAVGIAVALGFGGLMLLVAGNIFTAITGGLLLLVALFILLFSLKFFFWIKHPTPELRELKEEEAPLLFELMRQTAHEVKAPVPKKVYITMDINASVWIPNGILSFIINPSKYLTLGVPLLYSINQSELKSILAHEMAHFSQQTTWLTSYLSMATYTVHKVLFSEDALKVDNNAFAFFRFTAMASYFIINILREVLIKAYDLLHYTYQGLSRAMEHHADLTAASVAGTYNTMHGLRRTELAQVTFEQMMGLVLTIYQEQQKQPADIASLHQYRLQRTALGNGLALEETSQLPLIKDEDNSRLLSARVKYTDLWSSHPSNHDREAFLMNLPLPEDAATCHEPAYKLLNEPEKLSEELSAAQFDEYRKNLEEQAKAAQGQEQLPPVVPKSGITVLGHDDFNQLVTAEITKQMVSDHYRNYYFMRSISAFDVAEAQAKPAPTEPFDPAVLFSAEVDLMAEKLRYARQAYDILFAIANGHIRAAYFELDGITYKTNQAATQSSNLEKEVNDYMEQLKQHDELVFRSFYHESLRQAPETAERLLQLQGTLNKLELIALKVYEEFVNMHNALASLGQFTPEEELDRVNRWFNSSEVRITDFLRDIENLQQDPASAYYEKLKTIRADVLPDALTKLSVVEVNFEENFKLFTQVQGLYEKLLEVHNGCFRALIAAMDGVIAKHQETVLPPAIAQAETGVVE